jgi:hypothetical protein
MRRGGGTWQRIMLVEEQHVDLAGSLHRDLHAGARLACGIEYANFEFGIAEHTERYLVLASLGREV